jgi:chemotaxis protein methyltransferase CheR
VTSARLALAETSAPDTEPVEEVEVRLLLEGIWRHYGFDFREYAPTSMRRRIRHFMEDEGLATVSALQDRVLHDRTSLLRFMQALTVHVTSMFRDPGFYRALREVVVPVLRTYPVVRIWHAGCSTGEEVYSVAILLREEGLYGRCRIYATDLNERVLRRAQTGLLPASAMRENGRNFVAAGGRGPFSRWYTPSAEGAVLDPSLRDNVVFAQHNLATDGSFQEFNLILCRNVLIYFSRPLQDRVHRLLHASLVRFGFLALGAKETVRFSSEESRYQELVQHIFRKVA